VVFTSGYASNPAEFGAADFLPKPFDPHRLAALVDRHVAQRRAEAASHPGG
jgi:DNA-binding NtrC family response regulator